MADLSQFTDEELMAMAGLGPEPEIDMARYVAPIDAAAFDMAPAPASVPAMPLPPSGYQALQAPPEADLTGYSDDELMRMAGIDPASLPNARPMTGIKYGALGMIKDYMNQVGGLTEYLAGKIDPYIPDILPAGTPSPVESSRQIAARFGESQDDVGFQPTVDFDDVLADPLGKAPTFVAEQGPVSLPYMAAALGGLPGNIFNLLSLSGNIAEERAQNKGEAVPSGETAVESLPAGLLSALLDRLGVNRILKPVAKTPVGRIVGAGGREAATEAVQEGVIEYGGATIGTDKEFDPIEAAKRGGAGGLVGGPTGAAVRTPLELAQAVAPQPARKPPPPAALPPENAQDAQNVPLSPEPAQQTPVSAQPTPAPAPVQEVSPPAQEPVPAEISPVDAPEGVSAVEQPVEEKPSPEPNMEEVEPGYYSVQDTKARTATSILAGEKKPVRGDNLSGVGRLMLRRGVDPDFDAAVDKRKPDNASPTVTLIQNFDDYYAGRFQDAPVFEAEAAFDPALAGRDGAERVVGRVGDEYVAVDAGYYDYLVHRKGYQLRRAVDPTRPNNNVFGVFDGDQLVGYMSGDPGTISDADIAAARSLGPTALRGDDLTAYLGARRPGAPAGPKQKTPGRANPTAAQRKQAQAVKDETLQRLRAVRDQIQAAIDAGADTYDGERVIPIDTVSGQRSNFRITATEPGEALKQVDNQLQRLSAQPPTVFYSRVPAAADASLLPGEPTAAPAQSKAPPPAVPPTPPTGGGASAPVPGARPAGRGSKVPPGGNESPFLARRLLSMRRGLWRDAGLDPDIAENMPTLRQFAAGKKVFREKFGIDIELAKDGDIAAALNNLKDLYVELQVLANVTKLPNSAIGLERVKLLDSEADPKKRLKIIFRGEKAMGALGAYVRDTNDIWLPGRARSLAHEWGHALDYFMLDAMGKTTDSLGKHFRGYTARIRRDGENYTAASPAEAFIDVMNTLFFDESFAAAKIMELEAKRARARSDKSKADIDRQIEEVKAGNYKGKDYRSPYYRGAKQIPSGSDPGYWTRPTEMWARAFEAWVSYQAEKAGADIDLLTSRADLYTKGAGVNVFEKMYPKGPERARIFTAISRLMDAIAQSDIVNQTDEAPALLPLDADYADPLRWFKNMPGYQAPTKTMREAIIGTPAERAELRANSLRMLGLLKSGRPSSPITFAQSMGNLGMYMFSAMGRQLRVIEAKYKKNPSPTLTRLINGVWGDPGRGRYTGARYDVLESQFRDKYLNTLERITKRYKLKRHNQEEMDALRRLLLGVTDAVPDTLQDRAADLKGAAGALREIWNGAYADARENYGVDIGYIKDEHVNYINRVDDLAYVSTHRKESIEKYTQAFVMKYEDMIESGEFDPPDNFDIEAQAAIDAEEHVTQLVLSKTWDQGLKPPANGMTKSRTLPGRADLVLDDVRVTNPIDALEIYIGNLAGRSAWTKTLEPKDGDFNKAMKAMIREGVDPGDVLAAQDLILSAVGRREATGIRATAARGIDWTNAILTMVMLGRAPFASLHEPATVGLRTGNAADSVRVWSEMVKEVFGKADAQDRDDILQAYGIITSNLYSLSIAEREGGTYDNVSNVNALMTTYFRRNLLGPLTDFQRKVSVRMGQIYYLRLANAVMDPRTKATDRRYAINEFQESGIPAGKVDDFAQWLIDRDGVLPDIDNARGSLDSNDQRYARALADFSWQVIQNPKNINRSWAANTAPGRFIFGFMSFMFSFYENISKRALKVTADQYKAGGLPAATKYIAKGVIAPYAILYALSTATFTLRTLLLGHSAFGEKDDDEKLKYLMAGGLAYTSPAGPLADILYNVALKVKYDKDLSNAFTGKLGYILNGFDTILDTWRKNSANNNNQERNALQALYRLTAMPAAAIGTAVAPVPGPIGTVLGLANMWLGSRDAQDLLADSVYGPRVERGQGRTPSRRKEKDE